MKISLTEQDALVIVDLQNDFCPSGALRCLGGGKMVSVVNRLMSKFETVVATKDYESTHQKFRSKA